MPVLPGRQRLKFRGTVRAQMRKAERSLTSLLKTNDKRSFMTVPEKDAVSAQVVKLQAWLVQKTFL